MKLLVNFIAVSLITFLVINQVRAAPTISEAVKEKEESTTVMEDEEEASIIVTDSCDLEILKCELSAEDCKEKNRLKRQTICASNPQCPFCTENDDEKLIVEPEIVPTLNPPHDDDKVEAEVIVPDKENKSSIVISPHELKQSGKLIERNIVIENDNETHYYRGYVQPASNITTVIRLTNVIENKNIINMPTTLNNTNINNIHVYSNKSSSEGGKFGLGFTEDGPCCWSIKPATCKKTTVGLKCRHKRTRQCGRQCNKKMINTNRGQCIQTSQWPYMVCPQPPMMPPQNPWNGMPNYYPPPPQIDDEFDDDDDLPLFPEDEELEREDSGWVIQQEKCKVVSEDGLQVTNCTDRNVEFENSFARNTMDDSNIRQVRQTNPQNPQFNHQFYPQNFPNQMMMAQPIFIQPIYLPAQYFMPQSPVNYYSPQLPLPPTSDQYYDEPNYEKRDTNPYRNSRKHFKKIVTEHDDEL